MAKYGLILYGTETYGEVINVGAFYASDLKAWCYDYGQIQLTWNAISGDPADRVITHWKVIKTYVGTPDTPYDGTMVDGGTINNFRTSFNDTDANFGKQVFYSIWIFNGTTWIQCGSTYTTIVGDTGSRQKIERWFPGAWLNNYRGYGDVTGQADRLDLDLVLDAFAFEYDRFRADLNLLELANSSSSIPSQILPAKMADLGFKYEPSLGDFYHRALYRSGLENFSSKGTTSAIQEYIGALTHWSVDIDPYINMMLDYNDSSFEESTGHWYVTGGTFVNKSYSTSSTDLGKVIVAPVPNMYNYQYPPRKAGYGLITSTDTAVTISLPRTPAVGQTTALYPSQYGIPVQGGINYLFSGWICHIDTPAAYTVVVGWYDNNNLHIGSDVVTSSFTTTSIWSEFITGGSIDRQGLTAPMNASFAVIRLQITGTTVGNRFAIDMLQFAKSQIKTLEYQDPRASQLTVDGDQVNNIINPRMVDSTTGWFGYNASLTVDSNPPAAALRPGTVITTNGSATNNSTTLLLNNAVSGVPPVNYVDIVQGMQVLGTGIASGTTISSIVLLDFNQQASITLSSPTTAAITGNTANVTFFVPYNNTMLKVTATAAGTVAVVSEWMAVYPSRYYQFNVDVATTAALETAGMTNAVVRVEYSAPQSANEQTQILKDSQGYPYYSNDNSVTDSMPMMLTQAYQEMVSGGVAPDQTQDSPQPLAKVTVYVENANIGDVFYISNASFTHTMSQLGMAMEMSDSNALFFTGDGSWQTDDPLADNHYDVNDCSWEVRDRFNFVNNPSFATNTSGWTATGGSIAISSDTSPTAKFGTTLAKVTKSGSTVTASTTIYPPYTLSGGSNGEDIIASAYIYGPAGTYTISTTANGSTTSNSVVLDSYNANAWRRIFVERIPVQGETSFTVSIQSTATFYLDGVQVENGKYASKFIDPADAYTFKLPSLGNSESNYWATRTPSTNGGISNYWPNYQLKNYRLDANLPEFLPLGASYIHQPGDTASEDVYTEYGAGNLIESPSFEASLLGWTPTNAVLARLVSKGSIYNDLCSHGQGYCHVTSVSTGAFGLTSSTAQVYTNRGAVGSVVLKAPDSNGFGVYTLTASFYTTEDTSGTPVFIKSNSIHITAAGLWYYLPIVVRQPEVYGAGTSFATMSVSFVPDNDVAGTSHFYIDRTIFTQ